MVCTYLTLQSFECLESNPMNVIPKSSYRAINSWIPIIICWADNVWVSCVWGFEEINVATSFFPRKKYPERIAVWPDPNPDPDRCPKKNGVGPCNYDALRAKYAKTKIETHQYKYTKRKNEILSALVYDRAQSRSLGITSGPCGREPDYFHYGTCKKIKLS